MNLETLCLACMDSDQVDGTCPKCGRPADWKPDNAMHLRPGIRLRDQYLLGRALGHGGFGITYLGWDTDLARKTAIKEYMPNGVAGRASGATAVTPFSANTQSEFEWGLDKFIEEARVLARFHNHPAIVSVITFFRANGTAYLVMEYLDGTTFEDFQKRRGRITWETAMRIISPVLDALGAVHADGILHRDISPDNIYLTRAGQVKLIDFGAARNALSQKSRNLSIILKEGYAPEEQYRTSGSQGPWTDVYAVGATLYHALTGRIPPAALDRQAAAADGKDPLVSPAEMGVVLSPGAEAALLKALAIRGQDRFQSVQDFQAALSGYADFEAAHPAQAATPPASPAYAPPPRAAGQTPAPYPPPPSPAMQAPPPVWQGPPPGSLPPPPPVVPTRRPFRVWWLWIAGVVAASAIGFAVYKSNETDGREQRKKQEKQQEDEKRKKDQQKQEQDRQKEERQKEEQRKEEQNKEAQRKDRQGKDDARNRQDRDDKRTQRSDDDRNKRTPSSDYMALTYRAQQYMTQNSGQLAVQTLQQAITMSPETPRAYDMLGYANMYLLNDAQQAEQAYRNSIRRGGGATFRLVHDHSGTFATNCTGVLQITGDAVTLTSQPHSYRFLRSEIREVKNNRLPAILPGMRNNVNVINAKSFHIKAAGKTYNLAPTSRMKDQERDLIQRLLQ